MRQASSSFSKSKYVYLAAFFTPVILLTVIMLCSSVFPVGENCILKTDMYHQYAPFFAEFREKLKTGGSLKFTWDLGLGVNFTAIMAYYLASPLNWLVMFVGENYVIEFMSVMIVLKAGLSGVAMAAYFRHKAPQEYLGAYLFSLFYALSGYYCAYYWNIMWLDSIAVFPIVILGLERLVKGESGVLYAASLGYCILSNYYISIMVCIFLAGYFFLYSALEGYESIGGFVRTGLRFAFWSLIAGGISAVLLLPEIYALGATASSESVFPKTYEQYFSIFDMLARHMAGVETEQWLRHFPNIFCGTAVYLLFGLYVMSRRISLREKALYIGMAVFLLAGFSINVLNYIWHGMRYPNSLPARQSFVYCFLVIVMCFRVYENRRSIRRTELAVAFAASMGFIIAAQKLIDDEEFHFAVFYAALLLTAVYAGIFHLYRKGVLRGKAAAAAVIAVVIAELAGNTAATSFTITSRTAYLKNNAEIRTLLGGIEDDDIYRVERVSRKTKDDGAWLRFPSVSIFSSMANADCTDLFKHLGCEASTNAYSITGSTPFVDMLLGVRYAIYESEPDGEEGMRRIAEQNGIYLYENEYALPVGFMLPAGFTHDWMLELDDPALVQNSICDELEAEQVLKPVTTGSETGGKYSVTLSEDGKYYALPGNTRTDTVTVNWPDKKRTYEHLDRRYLMELGHCEKGDLIRMSADDGAAMNLKLYRFDYSALGDIYAKMASQPLRVTEHRDDRILGTVTVDAAALGYASDKALMLVTTPYDEGWTVRVDGEQVKLFKGMNAFVSFYLTSGEHEVEMTYTPRGLREGSLVTLLSVLLMLGITATELILKRKVNDIKVNKEN